MANEREEKKTFPRYSKWEEPSPSVSEPEDSDQGLIARAQGGDALAITALYSRYRVRILNYLYRFTGDRMTAEDLVQETFLRVVRHLPSYRPTGSAAGWIYRIAKNLALNHVRNRRGRAELSLDEPIVYGEGEEMDRSEAIPGPGAAPDEQANQAEQGEAIQGALLKVSAPYREVLILCDIEGHPYREAAEILRCSINTVASRLARGRVQMARLLGYLKKEER